jgi:deoxyadenosine/deoxycytidine kinase
MFIVEGNIGAGKSTFLRLIEKHLPYIETQQEPVDLFQAKVDGISILEQFYTETKRWSFTFENFAMACRVRTHIRDQQNDNPFRVIERSIYSGHYCFAMNGWEQGFMEKLEWTIYKGWFDILVKERCRAPRGFIYLRTTPEIAHERTLARKRSEEDNQLFVYLQQMHSKHEDFLIHKKDVLPELARTPVLVLDVNSDFQHDTEYAQELMEKLQDFVHKNSGRQPVARTMQSISI